MRHGLRVGYKFSGVMGKRLWYNLRSLLRLLWMWQALTLISLPMKFYSLYGKVGGVGMATSSKSQVPKKRMHAIWIL